MRRLTILLLLLLAGCAPSSVTYVGTCESPVQMASDRMECRGPNEHGCMKAKGYDVEGR